MNGSRPPIIEVSHLVKRFGRVTAVAGIDFSVAPGELFGFLGPNGAGKTTTINLLTGLARPDEGRIRVAGIDCTQNPKGAQHLMGIVPDESNLYPELSGFDNLCFCGALYGMSKKDRESRAQALLAQFGLTDAGARKFAGYSKGMKRRLTIAAGIIHQPHILFLDEPTTGIDVASARQIRQLIARLNVEGTTIFLTTHYIEEAERLCRRIAFIVDGKIVRTDLLENLMQPLQGRHSIEFVLEQRHAALESRLQKAFPSLSFEQIDDCRIRVLARQKIPVGPLVRFFEECGVEISEARKLRPTLEEVFVEVTGIEAAAIARDKERKGGAA